MNISKYTQNLSFAALGLKTVMEAWSKDNQSFGFLPLYVLFQFLSDDTVSDELVTAGIWTRSEDGFRINSFESDEAHIVRVKDHIVKLVADANPITFRVVEPEEYEDLDDIQTADTIETEGLHSEDTPEDTNNKVFNEGTGEWQERQSPPEAKKPGRVPMRVQAAEAQSPKITVQLPPLKDDGSDKNFDEFLDIFRINPESDRKCWDAWVEANKNREADDLLDAADDYAQRVKKANRMLPEVWLETKEFLLYEPYTTD